MIESPYERVLGTEFLELDPGVQIAHRVPLLATGTVKVQRGRGVLARLLAFVFGLPRTSSQDKVALQVCSRGERVVWHRRFANHQWKTQQWTDGDFIFESYGPITLSFALEAMDGTLVFRQVSARWGPVPLPVTIRAEVKGANEGWQVRVHISSQIAGLLCEYEACLKPE